MMNFLVSMIFFFTTNVTFATDKNVPPNSDLKSCLAAIYVAEISYHEEHKTYSDDFEKIGFDPSLCDFAEFLIEHYNNKFTVIAVDTKGKILGSIDSEKNLTLY